MSLRAVPFHCPYCAEENIEPFGAGKAYYCASCDRRFELTYLGSGEPADVPEGAS